MSELASIATRIVSSIPTGTIPAELLAPDFAGWTASSKDLPGAVYCERLSIVPKLFPDKLNMTIDETVQEGNRVVLRARSNGVLLTGQKYEQYYLFYMRFNDSGLLEHIREYMDSKHAGETMIPAIEAYLAQTKAAARG